MPTVERADDGKPVTVTPANVAEGAARFQAVQDGADVQAAEQAAEQPLPKRAVRGPAPDEARTRPAPKPKPEKARTTSKPSTALTGDQRRDGVKGLAQLGAGIALLLGKATGKDAFKADAVTIASNADEIASACVQTAEADPKFAAALDKVCSAGPYAALITVGVGIASQVARNHKPALKLAGTVDPAELLKAQDKAEAANVPAAA